jgi:DNA-binding NarL/FixJ family response regulator
MIRVAVVDDHPVARHGVRSMLSAAPDIEVVLMVAEPAVGGGVDVVIFDPYPMGVPACLQHVAELSAQIAVLVLSAACDPADVVAAMRAGARGYLTKQAGGETVENAIRSVVAGRVFVTPELATGVRTRPGRPTETLARPALSAREQLALAYIARGFTHQQTATRMGVSKATVDTYVGRIRTKLGVGNKAELALAALRYVEPRQQELAAQLRR